VSAAGLPYFLFNLMLLLILLLLSRGSHEYQGVSGQSMLCLLCF